MVSHVEKSFLSYNLQGILPFIADKGKKVSAKSDMYSSNSGLWKFAPSGKPVGKTVIYEVNYEISVVSKIGPDKR